MADFDTAWTPEFKTSWRLYSFVNANYMKNVQHGIQTGHAAVDLVRKYTRAESDKRLAEITEEWADNHKTFIILDAGNQDGLRQALELSQAMGYPFISFHEDEQSLDGILTCVAIILPDDIFNVIRGTNIHGETVYSWTRQPDNGGSIRYLFRQDDPQFKFVDFLKSKPLAR